MNLVGKYLNLDYSDSTIVKIKIVKSIEASNSCDQMVYLEGVKEPVHLTYTQVNELCEHQEFFEDTQAVKVIK